MIMLWMLGAMTTAIILSDATIGFDADNPKVCYIICLISIFWWMAAGAIIFFYVFSFLVEKYDGLRR